MKLMYTGIKYARRRFIKQAVAAGSLLYSPIVLPRNSRDPDPKRVVFVTEESNPRAQAAYQLINEDFSKETGISVTMEYPGFRNISRRVATLIAAGTPADLVWYGGNSALEVAIQGQFEELDDLAEELGVPDDARLIVDGHNRSIPTSQQFCYGWYRADIYNESSVDPYTDWDSYLRTIRKLNRAPRMYGNVIPSASLGASHILLQTMFQKNDVHWFEFDIARNDYSVALDNKENLTKAIETIEFLHEAHKYSPEASNYNWNEIMSAFFTGSVANSYYVGARLLEQTQANAPHFASSTKPIELPYCQSRSYYRSMQGFHIGKGSNVSGAKEYIKFFIQHPAYIKWLHSVPLHLIPAQRSVLHSEQYQANELIRNRVDVLEFLDSIWEFGVPPYYWDGPKLNRWAALYSNSFLGGKMLAERNIRGTDSRSIVVNTAQAIREKQEEIRRRMG